ncbi:hypothetical protein [Vibrio owensii]|uniref:hypothetical protein n=1 Tax=Vibrio owensii TaxID=696485 RepID=UPI0005EEB481|nr:hypothetical protein [Vibrio owensii]
MNKFETYCKFKSYVPEPERTSLSFDIAKVVYFPDTVKYSCWTSIFKCYQFCSQKDAEKRVLFTMGEYNNRADYDEILDFVSSKVEAKEIIELSRSKSFCVNVKSMYSTLHVLRKIFKSRDISFKQKLYIYSQCVMHNNTRDWLCKNAPVISKYVAFSSVHPIESIFVEHYKKQGIPTYSLQHGVAHVHEGELPMDMISYENFNADYQLCWGEYSIEQYANYGIGRDRLLLAGYPRNITNYNLNGSTSSNNLQLKPKILILMARNKFNKTNLRCLEMINKSLSNAGYEIYYKPHPSLQYKDYERYVKDKKYWLDKLTLSNVFLDFKFGFSVSVNTSAYYESFLYGVKSYMFIDDDYEGHAIIGNCSFNNEKKLLRLVCDDEPISDEKVNFILGHKVQNYGMILN